MRVRSIAAIFAVLGVAAYFNAASAHQDHQADQAPRGPFSLVDHTGREVSDEDYRGKYMLIAFGYIYCPDTCPTMLQTMGDALDILGRAGEKVQPIFITLDPERDTPELLAQYVAAFHPRLVGLSGTPARIAAAVKTYHVRFMKFFNPLFDKSREQDGVNFEYLLDHTSLIYLMGPDGRGLSVIDYGVSAEDLAARIGQFMDVPPSPEPSQ